MRVLFLNRPASLGVICAVVTTGVLLNIVVTVALSERSFRLILKQSTASGVIDVRRFGAKGDDEKDDTLSIQAAIDACHNQGGGRVYLPTGKYMIGAAGLRLCDRLVLTGDGDASVLYVPRGVSFGQLGPHNGGVLFGKNVKYVTIEKIRIQGERSVRDGFKIDQKGVLIAQEISGATHDVTVRYCRISGLSGEALYCEGGGGRTPSETIQPRRINFCFNVIENGGSGMNHNYSGPSESLVVGNHVSDIANIMYEGPGQDTIISNNIGINIGKRGIDIQNYANPDAGSARVNCQILGNRLRGGGTLSGGAHYVGENVGVRLCGYGVMVRNNDISGFAGPGVHVDVMGAGYEVNGDGGMYNIISGNTLHGNSAGANVPLGAQCEIYIGGGQAIIVTDNTLYSDRRLHAGIVIAGGTGHLVARNTVASAGSSPLPGGYKHAVLVLGGHDGHSIEENYASSFRRTFRVAPHDSH